MSISKITIKGVRQSSIVSDQNTGETITLEESILVGQSVRGTGATYEIELTDNKVIELIFEDETTWLCSRDSLEEIFPEATFQTRAGKESFEIPIVLRSEEQERGVFSGVMLKVVNIFAKKKLREKVKVYAADLERKQLDNTSGLFRLDKNFDLQKFSAEKTDMPYMLFIHGTSSSTKGSFGGMVGSPVWTYIQEQYGSNVIAFQHESLTKSPLRNVLELARLLPDIATLDIITHSRGGLVGDILSRYCTEDENNRGFNADEIKYLNKCERTEDIKNISEIDKIFSDKKIKIRHFIRVACPASGTTLASKRLDHFFNIMFNLIGIGTGLAANPVYIAFKNLIVSVIDYKNDINVLPGIEAMNPDSPLIKVLNNPASTVMIDNTLIVVSGNCKGKFSLKGLLIIASKLFFLKHNDLVVNTRSMYQGSKRSGPVQYFFDEGSDVDHFHYFKNKRTTEAIRLALQSTGELPVAGFSIIQQDKAAELERNAILKLEGGQVFTSKVTGTRPIVMLFPGIMGSNLSQNDDLIWIHYLQFITGGLRRINIKSSNVKAKSLVKTSYSKIVNYLSDSYDVVTFPFDWRHPLMRTADLLNDKVKELLEYNQPIKMIGHSMGGVLVRDFMVRHPETWKILNSTTGFRMIFLGSPLGGSYRIPFVLFGRDPIIDKISKIDIFNTKKELLNVFSKMPGLLSLLPHSKEKESDFSEASTWKVMQKAIGIADWPLPDNADLKNFRHYRDEIIKHQPDIDYSNMVYIAGRDRSTPCGYLIEKNSSGQQELIFLSTAEGDQSVTWDSGIPRKMIDQGSVYYVNVPHGALANDSNLFKGIEELLEKGSTNIFSKSRPVVRGEEKLFRTPEQHDFDLSPEGIEKTILGISEEEVYEVSDTPLKVSVSHGDLRYATYPVLAGHFLNDAILLAEKAIDNNLRGALSARHQLGLYPGEVGTSVYVTSNENDFPGTVIVGLGKPGNLTAFMLAQTVEQGITAYLLDLNTNTSAAEKMKGQPIGISALAIGCGYGGLSIENSVRAILEGIQNANNKIRKLDSTIFKSIQYVEFIEQYEDRALSCFYSVNRIENQKTRMLNVFSEPKSIKKLFGSRKRIPSEAYEEWWNRISVRIDEDFNVPGVQRFVFSASTGGAREVQRKLLVTTSVVEGLLEEISANNRWSPNLAKTIFELLIPNDFKDQLKKQCHINWILDKSTAGFPWELLQDRLSNARPLCVNSGMIRQLGTEDYRQIIREVSKNNALVVGDPDLKGYVTQLPGALKEGQLVSEKLNAAGIATTTLLKANSPEIIQALFSNDYKIIHLAGHGIFNALSPENSGMVIGNAVFLSTREIVQMSSVPELVFVNCCYLGKTDGPAEALFQRRYKLAANIGTQLIENGVKAVVVAGWAVDDNAALDFTEEFYEKMFAGYPFGEAVLAARQLIYNKYKDVNNTWGAYQIYGDPYYKFRETTVPKKEFEYNFIIPDQAEIELNNLHNELETGKYSHDEFIKELNAISVAVDKAQLRNAKISEKEAFIYADLCEYDTALTRFEAILKMENASFSVKALEKYCNVRAKKYVMDFQKGREQLPKLLSKINLVIKDLQKLLSLTPTAERNGLMASTLKRKGLLISTKPQKLQVYSEAAAYYQRAHVTPGNPNPTYTLTNWYALESILIAAGKRKWEQSVKSRSYSYEVPSKDETSKQLNELKNNVFASGENMDFWKMMSVANILLCMLIVETSTAEKKKLWEDVLLSYRKVWNMAGSKGNKIAEIEHLDFLIDALSLAVDVNAKKINKNLVQLKEELEKMV